MGEGGIANAISALTPILASLCSANPDPGAFQGTNPARPGGGGAGKEKDERPSLSSTARIRAEDGSCKGSESVFLPAQLECPSAAFHDRGDCFSNRLTVDRTDRGNNSSRIVVMISVSEACHQFRIPVYNKVCVMAYEKQLAEALR